GFLNCKDYLIIRLKKRKSASRADEIGAVAMGRLTKTYFSHWSDLSPDSAQVEKHGATIMAAIGEAISKIHDLVVALSKLSGLHAFKLRVDPVNFKVRTNGITLCKRRFRSFLIILNFILLPEVHVSVDKFLNNLAWLWLRDC
uniref:Globin domain-containing protein n=1 Tax=Oryzias latipes TaxID=8090 RepID=A0A3B3I7H0_ORYLA